MELTGHEVRVRGDLDDLDELLLRPDTRDPQPVLLELREVVVVDLVALAVALLDNPLAVEARGEAPLAQHDRIEAEPHRAALVGDAPLLGQEVDHLVRRLRVELGGVRAGEAADVAGELDHRALHAEADAEVRHALLARVPYGLDLPLDATVAEAAGHQDAVDVGEVARGALALDLLGVHPADVHARLARDPAVGEGFDEALVGVLDLDVLPHHGDPRLGPRRLHALDHRLPARQVGRP